MNSESFGVSLVSGLLAFISDFIMKMPAAYAGAAIVLTIFCYLLKHIIGLEWSLIVGSVLIYLWMRKAFPLKPRKR